MSSPAANLISKSSPSDQLIQLISPWITPLDYQVIHLEVLSHPQNVLRVYIDFLKPESHQGIGIEDCVKVSKTLDEKIDQTPEIAALLPSTYELEVSSPGVNRPLRALGDFERFKGQAVRIHLYRPMTSEEMENPSYFEKNPKQKNFKGTLAGLQGNKVVLTISSQDRSSQELNKSKAKKKALLTTNSVEEVSVTIPLPLISKANLEPEFSFEGSDERE